MFHICFMPDDLKIYHRIDTSEDCLKLQEGINVILDWGPKNNFSLNKDKCFIVSFSRKSSNVMFDQLITLLKVRILNEQTHNKDLRVLFDSKLSFKDHIENIMSVAYKILGFVIRNGRYLHNVDTLSILYKTLVHYIYRVHISSLENVQRKFAKFLVYMLDSEYPVRGYPNDLLLERVQIASLSTRRVYFSVKCLY